MYSKDQIYEYLRGELVSLFELDAEAITPESNLYEELDIDSIDAVDLMAQLRSFTGKRIEPTEFKEVRTVQDVVDTVYNLVCVASVTEGDTAEAVAPQAQQG